jgi:hypothetical protein
MPCSDGIRDSNVRVVYEDNPRDKEKIEALERKIILFEAGLCAIITELDREKLSYKILSNASKNGGINLMEFWNEHTKNDESRIGVYLHKLSDHELDIAKKLLKD